MALPLPLAGAADLFVETFMAYDEVSTKTLGSWEAVTEPDRAISGVIQTRNEKDIRLEEDGALSTGSLMLHTRENLSAYDLTQNGQILRQTYVRYSTEIWKLRRVTDWPVKTQGYNLFYLEKYTSIGGLE